MSMTSGCNAGRVNGVLGDDLGTGLAVLWMRTLPQDYTSFTCLLIKLHQLVLQKMAQQLKMYTVLTEDLSSVPSTHIR